MVFCGKASGGCHACRARKTRCDQIPEGCTQCQRAKRTCPGYRAKGELIFRDQSSNVVRKFKAKEAREKSLTPFLPTQETESVVGLKDIPNFASIKQEISPLSIQFALAPNIEDRAISIFIFNHVIGTNGPSTGYLDQVLQLSHTSTMDEHLLTSMKAVGLAAYAHAVRAPSLRRNATYQYMKAIQLTNAALRHPEEAKKDSTLMAIQVLSIFETVTGCKRNSLKDWMEHIRGAAAVIKMRGLSQLKTLEGRRMLAHVTSSLLIICVHMGIRMPEHMREYMKEAFYEDTQTSPGFRIQDVMVRYGDLRASINEGSLQDYDAIIARASELDKILLDICFNPPPGWEYKTVFTDADSDVIYNGTYHVYYDHWVALMWNTLRVVRIMLTNLIRQTLINGFSSKPPMFIEPTYTAQFQLVTDTILEMQREILSSVAQHIGRGDPPKAIKSNALTWDPSSTNYTPIPASGGSFLMWPLWFVATMDAATDSVREFAARNLHSIAEVQGIQQAHVLAKMVATKTIIKV